MTGVVDYDQTPAGEIAVLLQVIFDIELVREAGWIHLLNFGVEAGRMVAGVMTHKFSGAFCTVRMRNPHVSFLRVEHRSQVFR